MRFEVFFTEDTTRDLEDIYDYVAEHDDPKKAQDLLDRIQEVIDSLSNYPARGTYPRELARLGIREYRQIIAKPYRIIYRMIDKRIYVYLIADGRRDFQTLLTRRLLRAT